MSELNKQIAKVLGIVWDEELTDKMVGAALWVETENHDDEEDGVFRIYDWQNSIEQAIELLEGLEWTMSRDIDHILYGHAEYSCFLRKGSTGYGPRYGKTPAEAICKAFLTYKLQENK